jgi:hypothetical protein
LYGAWDDQFYPDGIGAWMAKLDVDPSDGLSVDESFFPHGDDFRGLRVPQIQLQGADASSGPYCYRRRPRSEAPQRLREVLYRLANETHAGDVTAWLESVAATADPAADERDRYLFPRIRRADVRWPGYSGAARRLVQVRLPAKW